MGEAKLESSRSHFAPRSMQMILLQLTSISGSGSRSMMKIGCRVGAQHRHRMMYSFNFRVMTCCIKTAELAGHCCADSTSLSSSLTQICEEAATCLCMQMGLDVVEKHFLVNLVCNNCFSVKRAFFVGG